MRSNLFFKISGYLLGLIMTYVLVVFGLTVLSVNGRPLSWYVLENKYESGTDSGQSLLKFRDIEQYRGVDILIMGSSHAYRSFDPRIFRSYGLGIFNLGTTAQAPANSFFLLKAYYPKLRPKRIIFETYFAVFENEEGLESFYSIVRNAPLLKEIVFMACAIRSPQAINSLLSEWFTRFWRPLSLRSQRPIRDESYVSGGYVDSRRINEPGKEIEKTKIKWGSRQLDFLKRIVDFSKKHNAELLFVLAPLPERKIVSIQNYNEIISRFREASRRYGVPFYTFETLGLDQERDFKDDDHLNYFGAQNFNLEILKILKVKTPG